MALVDGCSRLELLWRIVPPLAAPEVVAVAWAFLLSWNEFLFAYVFSKGNALTTPVGIRTAFLGQCVNSTSSYSPLPRLQLPPTAIFVSLQGIDCGAFSVTGHLLKE